ncbi:MAG TPA: 16S rRNA (adenine(1518)-N(6)/adenine(1519)-N(6))-dimethyltransferase RsmA [Acidobacteriota bacterium]|nr:16S rRNA (adenine(1518)-N(6)/adenine(1519)-N(6))-dimethyltransferase RsmA [Acidobacteriota bacterium]HJO29532.1 16S rRNA (adenine(1518)-N(6)/adenine(1519)-N(6))-dimethyltransferase RsmA [Acidobacteriota bacterium]
MPVPLRRFSQNWLANDELAVALVRSMKPRSGDHFLEIGGGEGRMTRALLQHDVRVTTIEVDKRCCETLEALARNSAGKLSVIHSDVLEYDPPKSNGHELRFVGNLPYAIASPILRWTVEHHKIVSDAYYMVPMDIAKRILAAAGSSERALLSVLIGWFFDGKMLRRLGPGAFRPEPKIKSAFVRLQPHEPPSCAARRQHWETVVQGSFAHRRKTLLNSLRQSGWQRDEIERALAAVDIDISTRAESLKVIQFARLAEELPELVQ